MSKVGQHPLEMTFKEGFLPTVQCSVFKTTWKLEIEILFDSNWFLRKGDFLSAHFHFSIHLIGTVWLLPVKLRNSLRLEHEPCEVETPTA